ncbi:hypothetical protein QT972_31085 [Microcoleus sp. herbarium7]|uniref:hypothetical protein n=1 Tax=Microcoleus sp. herbarium7 TaxID=3055435 RepID=UPI002FD46FEA
MVEERIKVAHWLEIHTIDGLKTKFSRAIASCTVFKLYISIAIENRQILSPSPTAKNLD